MQRAVFGWVFALAIGVGIAPAAAQSVSTPRMPDGKPDLSGVWNEVPDASLNVGGSGRGIELSRRGNAPDALEGGGARPGFRASEDPDGGSEQLFPSRRCAPNQPACRDNTNQSNDGEMHNRTHPNRPLYKPQAWQKVQDLDYDLNNQDPLHKCYPLGLPRIGRPRKIVQTAKEIVFFYGNDTRIIPLDGSRPHDPDAPPEYFGYSVGHWEGDTLVVDVRGFNDTTWLAGALQGGFGGYFHSFELRVIERLRREGNTLHYQATIEDPEVLLEPWVMNARTLRLNTNPSATVGERAPCIDIDAAITTSRIRH